MTAAVAMTSAAYLACGSFGTAVQPTTTDNPDVQADVDAASSVDAEVEASADAKPREASVLFEDEFNRPDASDVKHAWDSIEFAQNLTISTAISGNVLVAFSPAVSGGEAGGWLTKRFPPRTNIEVSFLVQQKRSGGTFGTAGLNYCEFVAIELGDKRVALVFTYDKSAGFFLYGPNEVGGEGPTRSNIYAALTPITMKLEWNDAEITLRGMIDGNDVGSATKSLSAGIADKEVTLHFGTRCQGYTSAVEATLDKLVVQSYE